MIFEARNSFRRCTGTLCLRIAKENWLPPWPSRRAYNRDVLAAEKIAIASGASGNAIADQFALGLKAHEARRRARRE